MGQIRKQIKGVMVFKHETEANWNLSSYIPENGEQVIYDPDDAHTSPRIKIGNGIDIVKDLPFASEDLPISKGEGANSLVINEGVASGNTSIAGGTTDTELIKSVLGKGYADIIDMYRTKVNNSSDEELETLLNLANLEYTVEEFRRMINIIPSTAEALLGISLGASNKSISTADISLGYGNISGAKGYYVYSLSFDPDKGDKLNVSNERYYDTEEGEALSPSWEAEDRLLIVLGGNRYLVKISRINGLTIYLKDVPDDLHDSNGSVEAKTISLPDLKEDGSFNFLSWTEYDITNPIEGAVINLDKPESGEVEFGWGAVGIGALNTILGSNAFGVGYKNLIFGDFGASFGQENTVGYSALSSGIGNKSLGKATFTSGEGNEASVDSATALGKDTKARAKYSTTIGRKSETKDGAEAALVGGNASVASHYGAILHGNWLTSSRAYQAVFGEYNLDNDKALLIVGNGDDGERGNVFEVLKNGSALNGVNCDSEAGRAFAGGNRAVASKYGSFLYGNNLTNSRLYQTVLGEYNNDDADALLIVGNGTSEERSNAFKVMSNGGILAGEDCELKGERSLAGGYKCKANHRYSIAYGSDLSTSRDFQAVFGYDNMDNPDAFLIVGRGDYKAGNAFEVICKNGVSSIKVGNTEITEAQLAKLIKFIDSIEEVTE